MARKAMASVVPSKGWWRRLSIEEFQVECDRLSRAVLTEQSIRFTHKVLLGRRCIGRAAAVETLPTLQHIGVVLFDPPLDLVGLCRMLGAKRGKATYLIMPKTLKLRRIIGKV